MSGIARIVRQMAAAIGAEPEPVASAGLALEPSPIGDEDFSKADELDRRERIAIEPAPGAGSREQVLASFVALPLARFLFQADLETLFSFECVHKNHIHC